MANQTSFNISIETNSWKAIYTKSFHYKLENCYQCHKNVPVHHEPLHEALDDVKKTASAYINLSRLQLAIQGLESEKPITRVAVLGLNIQTTARRIVRLLLADALEKEGKWEQELIAKQEDYGQELLIRYGHPPNSSLPRPANSIPVLYIPSSVLERNNIEILVTSIGEPQQGEELQSIHTTPSEAILSPTIKTLTNANGRYTLISQPVHNSLIVGSGLDELMTIAELLAATKFTSAHDRQSVSLAINIPDTKSTVDEKVLIFDASKAEDGLVAIRRSLGEATVYEHKWFESGMPLISKWLTSSSALRSSEQPPSPVRNLIVSLLASARMNVKAQELLQAQSSRSPSINSVQQAQLTPTIDEFSRNAHLELQSGLASAWSSRNWRKLTWYKLFWRVDDVGLIITDLISNAWLPNTERAVYELSGRLAQVGISPMDGPREQIPNNLQISTAMNPIAPTPEISLLQTQFTTGKLPINEPVIINPAGTADVNIQTATKPLPLSLSISSQRTATMQRAITSLTSSAQQLVLRTLSITGLSAGLSGLAYVSLTPGNLYESGTIVALGTAFALWRMQRGWQTTTKALEDNLFDEGRNVIRHVVDRMRYLVEKSAESPQEDPIEVHARRQAEKTIEKAQMELDKLKSVQKKA